MSERHRHDLSRRLAAARDYIAHLRAQRDMHAARDDLESARTLARLEADLRLAEIDAIRLQAAMENMVSAD